jgi:hypothetical protein
MRVQSTRDHLNISCPALIASGRNLFLEVAEKLPLFTSGMMAPAGQAGDNRACR